MFRNEEACEDEVIMFERPNEAECSVFVSNLPLDVKNEEVSEAFSKYGLIHRASVLNMDKYVGPLPDTACAIVTFYLKSSAQAAITDSGSIAIRKDESGTKRVK